MSVSSIGSAIMSVIVGFVAILGSSAIGIKRKLQVRKATSIRTVTNRTYTSQIGG